MTFVIRTDASSLIGTGHVMRCLSLAEALKKRGAQVVFVSREHEGNLCQLVESQGGFTVLRLPRVQGQADVQTGYAQWLGVSQAQDARETLLALDGRGLRSIAVLIVDHYGLDRAWEQQLRARATSILIIDDLANRPHDADFLLDANLRSPGKNPYEDLCPPATRYFLGPAFALLREEFSQPLAARADATGAPRGLVYFGGTDATGETLKALQAIRELNRPEISYEVVVGKNNPRQNEIRAALAQLPNVRAHFGHTAMDEVMSRSDFAVGAAGTTAWERCRFGLPSIVIAVADNQVPGATAMAKGLQQLYLGTSAEATVERLREALGLLIGNPLLREAIARLNRELVDGRGTSRIVRALLQPRISLRPATLQDSARLHQWRNAPVNREHSFDDTEISLESHERWIRSVLADPNRPLLIGEGPQGAFGVIRYDITGESAAVSVYLVPGFHGQNLGAPLLEAGSLWLKAQRSSVRAIFADIQSSNRASQKTFEEAGYRLRNLTYCKELQKRAGDSP